MTSVASIRIDDVMIEVERNFFAIPVFGSAEIDADGAVISVSLDGFEYGEQVTKDYDVPSRYTENVSRNGQLIRLIAAAVQAQRKDSIEEALADWREAISVREYEPAE